MRSRNANPLDNVHRLLRNAALALLVSGCSEPVDQESLSPDGPVALVEIGRIGSIDGASAQLSRVSSVYVDQSADEIFVADGIDRSIRVFDRDGQLLRQWGRAGEGPGEFEGAPRLTLGRDSVLVIDGTRYHFFDRDGTHLVTGRLESDYRVSVGEDVWAQPDGWAVSFREVEPGVTGPNPYRTWYQLSPESGVANRLHRVKHPGGEPSGLLSYVPTAVPGGHVLVEADTAAYELQIIESDGAVGPRLAFDVPAVPMPTDVEGLAREAVLEQCAESASPVQCEVVATRSLEEQASRPRPAVRPIPGVIIASRDSLAMIQRADLEANPFAPGDETIYDLVHLRGERLGTYEVEPNFIPHWFGGGELWGVVLGEFDVPYVVGFSVPPT